MRICRIIDPVTHCLVGRIFQSHTSTGRRNDRGAQDAHTLDVGTLALHVYLPHVDDTLHSHQCAYRRGSNAMLSGTCFGNDLLFSQPLRQQNLPDGIVHFVRTRMTKIFPFKIDRGLEGFREPCCLIKRRGPTYIVAQQLVELLAKSLVLKNRKVVGPKLFHIGIKHFRNVCAPKFPVVSTCIGVITHNSVFSVLKRSRTSRIFSTSFSAGRISTPLLMSMATRL